MKDSIHVLSLGAGVQSSTLALMAAKGIVTPMPDAAIFADVQAEPKAVYEWLDWLERQLPFPVYRVTKGSLTEQQLSFTKAETGADYVRNLIPAYTENPDGTAGMLLRKCTGDYKLQPIRKKTRELHEAAGKLPVVQWIGISLDEAIRMKPSGVSYIENRWPLIEMRITRQGCLAWMKANGYKEPPKSACVYCPYHNDHQWRDLKNNYPEEFERAAAFEDKWNEIVKQDLRPSQTRGKIRLHRSLLPLREVDFTTEEQRGQLNLFNNECEGMCGV